MSSENSKNPEWKVPVNLPSVTPGDYPADIASTNGSAASKRDTKDGTKGFAPQLAGNGVAGHTDTSSFDIASSKHSEPAYKKQ